MKSQQVWDTCTRICPERGRGRYMLTTSPLSNHHVKHPLLQWRHNHFHTEGQNLLRNKGISYKTPTQHDDVGLIPPIPHLCIPAQDPRRQRTLLGVASSGHWATLGPPPPTFTVSYPFWDKSNWHIEAGQSLHQHQMKTDTQRRHSIHPDRHLPIPQMMHTGTGSPTTSDLSKPLPILYCFGLSIARPLPQTTYFRKYTPTLADAEPTDPIDESHPEPSCSQSHWLQHKTTDEDKTLLTTPWSTLKAHSCVPFHTDIHFFLSLFPSHLPSPLVFWLHPC